VLMIKIVSIDILTLKSLDIQFYILFVI